MPLEDCSLLYVLIPCHKKTSVPNASLSKRSSKARGGLACSRLVADWYLLASKGWTNWFCCMDRHTKNMYVSHWCP